MNHAKTLIKHNLLHINKTSAQYITNRLKTYIQNKTSVEWTHFFNVYSPQNCVFEVALAKYLSKHINGQNSHGNIKNLSHNI